MEADWALVGIAQQQAPDLAPAAIAAALARLQHHAVHISGAAVLERLPNPFARWVRRAA